MVTQNETTTIIVIRKGHRYFYSRQNADGAIEKMISRERAKGIVQNNANGRATSGTVDFGALAATWTWQVVAS